MSLKPKFKVTIPDKLKAEYALSKVEDAKKELEKKLTAQKLDNHALDAALKSAGTKLKQAPEQERSPPASPEHCRDDKTPKMSFDLAEETLTYPGGSFLDTPDHSAPRLMTGTSTPVPPRADTLDTAIHMYTNLNQEVQGNVPVVLERGQL